MNAPSIQQPSLLEIARQMVPRYTSYPTAPHFGNEVDGDLYGSWLEAAGAAGEHVSLYLHVPFCRTICNYCGCTTKAALRDDPIRAYADVAQQEIDLLAERLGSVEVSHIHWGGGTPSILPADCLEALVRQLADRFRFRDDMEHAIELDPRRIAEAEIMHLARLGVNRASLGVQTLDARVQKAIGRIQPWPVVERAMAALRSAGMASVNVDLMYGLPFQNDDSIRDTARQVLALAPDRFAVFGYAHVPWMKPHQRLIDEAALPDAEARIGQARLIRELLEDAGYVEIGIDHFARPEDELAVAQTQGRLGRNFQGYTDDGAACLVGIGASSISRTPQGYAQNASDNRGWQRAIESGRLPTKRGKAFSSDDRMRAEVIEEILCRFAVDLDVVASRHDCEVEPLLQDAAGLDALVSAGWVVLDRHRLSIERHRQEIARVVASAFDTYLGRGGRHSAAV